MPLSLRVERPSRLAQLVERKTFNLVVVGSSPTVGAQLLLLFVFARFFLASVRQEQKKKKDTTPGIPTWSPTVVLAGPDDA